MNGAAAHGGWRVDPSGGAAGGQVPARVYDVALLDLDGVVYQGTRPVAHAAQALRDARAVGMTLAFVTNNASRTPRDVAALLGSVGVPAEPREVVTSAQAAARIVAERVPPGSAVLVVGGAGLEVALRERGLKPVRAAEDGPVAVVQGYAADVDWRALAEASYAVSAGALWVASNVDATLPTERGVAPGNGALVDAVATATGVRPVVAGKPELPLHRESVARTGARRPLVVGDRLDTDIEGAVTGGVDSLLVLTGVTGLAALFAAPSDRRPTYVAADLRGLVREQVPVRMGPAGQRGEVTAEVRDGVLVLGGAPTRWQGRDGRWHAAVRAACVACWAWADGHPAGCVAEVADVVAALEAAPSEG